MKSIMFVCHGNICRSPMAEFIMKDIVKKNNKSHEFIIESSAVSREEIGNYMYSSAKEILKKNNIEYKAEKRAVQLTKEDYDKYDYIICMDSYNLYSIGKIIPQDPQNKIKMLLEFTDKGKMDIADPWYTGRFEITYKEISTACNELYEFLIK